MGLILVNELGKERTPWGSGPLKGLETEHKSKCMVDRVMRLQLRGRKH